MDGAHVFGCLQPLMLPLLADLPATPALPPYRAAPQVVALITIELHTRDVMERMIRADCSGVDDFEWLSQLRLEYSKSDGPYGGVVAKQTKSTLEYSFEYQVRSGALSVAVPRSAVAASIRQ